jgi:DNA-binding transcriptional ArsR family regulator
MSLSDRRVSYTLRLLAEVAETWNGDPAGWSCADEVAHRLGRSGPGAAQGVGAQLAALERRGLVEVERRSFGNSYRLSERVRAVIA